MTKNDWRGRDGGAGLPGLPWLPGLRVGGVVGGVMGGVVGGVAGGGEVSYFGFSANSLCSVASLSFCLFSQPASDSELSLLRAQGEVPPQAKGEKNGRC